MKKINYLETGYFINQIYKYQQQFPNLMNKEDLYQNIVQNKFNNGSAEVLAKYGDWKYFTPMTIEIFMNNLNAVKTLVDQGYDFNENVRNGLTPLMIATYLGRKEIRDYLYYLNKDIVNQKDSKGRDLLKFACAVKDVEFVYQLTREADINSEDNKGLNALHYNLASCLNVVYLELLDDSVEGLVESDFKENSMNINEIIKAEFEISKILIENKIDLSGINPISSINFHWSYKHLDRTLNLLLQNGCSTTFDRNIITIFEENGYSFKMLLEDIKDFDLSEWLTFPYAYKKFKNFEKLIKKYNLTVNDYEYNYSISCGRELSKVRTSYENGVRKKYK